MFLLTFALQGQNEVFINTYEGTSTTVQINGDAATPIVKTTPTNGTLELTTVVNNNYIYTYTPDENYTGLDVFTIDEVISLFPIPEVVTHVITVDVMLSLVEVNDDFFDYAQNTTITIDPMANDVMGSDNVTLSIAQVVYGDATVTSDGYIEYTAGETERDFIVYNVKDGLGTYATGTIYLYEDSSTDVDTEFFADISSGTSTYIKLPTGDYTLSSGSLLHGSLELIRDDVYEYISNSDGNGIEAMTFTNSDGLVHSATIEVLLKLTDDGFVKNDVFYTASNTQSQFDVKANDINTQYVVSGYSPELIHLGNGMFSYTPPTYFIGTKTFFYEADNGVDTETGEITVVVNNFNPNSFATYELSSPKNQPRILQYDVPIGTEYFEIASFPYNGDVEIFTQDDNVSVACTDIQKLIVLYTPDNGFVGDDNFVVRYCASGNNACQNVSVEIAIEDTTIDDCICVDDCVWPGDANGDGQVNIRDVLSISRHLGKIGDQRDASPYAGIYDGADADDWGIAQSNGRDISHADTDGNGIIDVNDITEVIENYGSVNNITSLDLLGVKDVPFYVTTDGIPLDSGDVLNLYVHAGTDDWKVQDMEGIAFSLFIPSSLVDSSSLQVDFVDDGFFVDGAPFVESNYQPTDGQVHVAGGKTNNFGSTGNGLVAVVSFIVEEDAEGIRNDRRKRFASSIGESETLDIELSDIVYQGKDGFQYSLPSKTIQVEINSNQEVQSTSESHNISVSPNPVENTTVVSTSNNELINNISLFDVNGRVVMVQNASTSSVNLNLSTLTSGIYVAKIQTASGIESTKIAVR